MSVDPGPFSIETTFLHLSNTGAVQPLPVNASFWPDLMSGRLGLDEGRLVSRSEFASHWASWEMHPLAEEVVLLLSGEVDFVLEVDRRHRVVPMRTRFSFIVVPRGVWHTARVHAPAVMLFLTAGEGTEHRPVKPGEFPEDATPLLPFTVMRVDHVGLTARDVATTVTFYRDLLGFSEQDGMPEHMTVLRRGFAQIVVTAWSPGEPEPGVSPHGDHFALRCTPDGLETTKSYLTARGIEHQVDDTRIYLKDPDGRTVELEFWAG